jgi:hypothetical protein
MKQLATIKISLDRRADAIIGEDTLLREQVKGWAVNCVMDWRKGTISCGLGAGPGSWALTKHADKPDHFVVSFDCFNPS